MTNLHEIFPHQRVKNQNQGLEEIFDIYQLGLFPAPDSFLASYIEQSTENKPLIYENLELVELQPESEYKPHFHKNSAAVIYIIKGSGIFLLADQQLEYCESKRIIIPSGVMHGFKTYTYTLFLSIQSPPIIDPKTQNIDLHYEAHA